MIFRFDPSPPPLTLEGHIWLISSSFSTIQLSVGAKIVGLQFLLGMKFKGALSRNSQTSETLSARWPAWLAKLFTCKQFHHVSKGTLFHWLDARFSFEKFSCIPLALKSQAKGIATVPWCSPANPDCRSGAHRVKTGRPPFKWLLSHFPIFQSFISSHGGQWSSMTNLKDERTMHEINGMWMSMESTRWCRWRSFPVGNFQI
jgi:hypothetical protein